MWRDTTLWHNPNRSVNSPMLAAPSLHMEPSRCSRTGSDSILKYAATSSVICGENLIDSNFFISDVNLSLTSGDVKCILCISQYTHIDMKATTLKEKIQAGGVHVIDVRTGAEWRGGHIVGAEFLPLDALEQGQMPSVVSAEKDLVIVCQSGVRAAKAQAMLRGRGVEAAVLEGGMNAWAEAGMPQQRESGGHTVSVMRQVQLCIGSLNLIGLALGIWVAPLWLMIPAFTSMGLMVAGATGTCGLALVLARMPWNK